MGRKQAVWTPESLTKGVSVPLEAQMQEVR